MKHIKGNILDYCNNNNLIVHGVNCQNVMGAGVAKALYEAFPKIKKRFHDWGESSPKSKLGLVQHIDFKDFTVFNAFTQLNYGKRNIKYASPYAILLCLDRVVLNYRNVYNSKGNIFIPEIGCGLGGLSFQNDLIPIIEFLELKYDDIDFNIVSLNTKQVCYKV